MIVVTGAKGTIGRAVVAQLSVVGFPVAAISRDIFDLSAEKDLTSVIDGRPRAIIHLAAAVPHSPHYLDTDASSELTRRIDRCVNYAARIWDCRVIYASTCSLYDKLTEEVKFEESPIFVRPDSPYIKAKSDGEDMFSQLDSYALMRVPAPIGPGLPSTVVAKRFFDLACTGKAISLWGSGLREQNYVDVSDIADVMIKAATVKVNGLFNIAADEPTTMRTLATTMVKVIGRGSVEFLGTTPDPLENERTRYSNRRARSVLGWSQVVSLEDSIRSMLGPS